MALALDQMRMSLPYKLDHRIMDFGLLHIENVLRASAPHALYVSMAKHHPISEHFKY